MKICIFSVYDTKALNYGVPFFMPTVGAAVRAFTDLANDKQSSVNRHPTDYLLMQIGEFDDSNAQIASFDVVKNLGLASDYIEAKKPAGAEQFNLDLLKGAVNGKESAVEVVR